MKNTVSFKMLFHYGEAITSTPYYKYQITVFMSTHDSCDP